MRIGMKAKKTPKISKISAETASNPIAAQRRSKPNIRGEKARNKILSEAARHFSEFGFRGASAAAIAHDAGISEPGLLHHFGSKKGLLMALIERRYSLDQLKLHADEKLEGLSLLSLLTALVRENLKQREAVKLAMVMLGESTSTHHPSHEYFRRRYVDAREVLIKHLTHAQKNGSLRAGVDTEALSAILLAVMDGLQLQWLLDKRVDMAHCFEVLTSLLDRALTSGR
jgi:AcrR family transcriptional regulator